jgi:hypothetical protein
LACRLTSKKEQKRGDREIHCRVINAAQTVSIAKWQILQQRLFPLFKRLIYFQVVKQVKWVI